MNLLIAQDCNINQVNAQGDSVLMLAISKHQTETVKCLMQQVAKIELNYANPNTKETALSCAVQYTDHEIVPLLIKYGAHTHGILSRSDLLHKAANRGSSQLVELLFQHGATIDQQKCMHDLSFKSGVLSDKDLEGYALLFYWHFRYYRSSPIIFAEDILEYMKPMISIMVYKQAFLQMLRESLHPAQVDQSMHNVLTALLGLKIDDLMRLMLFMMNKGIKKQADQESYQIISLLTLPNEIKYDKIAMSVLLSEREAASYPKALNSDKKAFANSAACLGKIGQTLQKVIPQDKKQDWHIPPDHSKSVKLTAFFFHPPGHVQKMDAGIINTLQSHVRQNKDAFKIAQW